MEEEKIIFCKSGGCTAKLGAGVLEHILEKLPKGEKDPNLLVGYDSKDDASVYRLTDDLAMVQTLDFFPPAFYRPPEFLQYNHTYSEKSLPRPSHEAGIFYRSWYFRPSNSSGTESFFIPDIFWFLWFSYFTAI